MHNFAVHHILIVLRDQSDDKVEKDDQQNDLGSHPECVDCSDNCVVQSWVPLFVIHEIYGRSIDVSDTIFECLENVSNSYWGANITFSQAMIVS